jgi:putative ATP-dependent endonuclease of OLD family
MKIFDISIRNFRGISELKNLKCGDITTFVGKNDSGKSIILKALDAFFNHEFSPEDVFKGKPEKEFAEITIRFQPSFSVNSLALDNEDKICLNKKFYFDKAGKIKIETTYTCFDINDPTFQNAWGLKESDLNKMLDILGETFSRSGRGVTNLTKIENISTKTSSKGKILATYPADDYIKALSSQYPDFEIPEFSLFDAEENLDVTSTDFQGQFKQLTKTSLDSNVKLTTQIEGNVRNDLEQEFDVISSYMVKNVPELEKLKPKVNCNWNNLVKFTLDLKFNNEAYDIPISHKGTGFKRLLMVAYFEYLAQKQKKRYQIFGIEEPETYLHPELQADLLETIITLSSSSQFFITTHSPVFAGATNDANIVIVKKVNSKSEYQTPVGHHDILNQIIEELGIRPNYNLLNDNYRKIIFVEGKGDSMFWSIAMTKLNGGVPADILFIPCGGDQIEFFVNAKLCTKLNRRFAFVVDSDHGAVDYAAKQANKLALKNKIEGMNGQFEMLNKREAENYYHAAAIQRILGVNHALSAGFAIGDYSDIKVDLENEIPNNVRSILKFKLKNNDAIFKEMTPQEWQQTGFIRPTGNSDLEEIIQMILSQ